MVYKLGTLSDLEKIVSIDDKVKNVIAETLKILDDNYGSDRNIDNDYGGYVLYAEPGTKDTEILTWFDYEQYVPEYIITDTTTSLVVNNVARLEEYGGVEVANLYSKLTTKLRFTESDEELNDKENDSYILKSVEASSKTIIAWGRASNNNARIEERAVNVLNMLEGHKEKLYMECSKESLFKLAEIAKKCGGYMAVEDLPRTCLGRDSSEINELISVHSDLKVCFDTNHLLGESIEDFISNVGDKIITTHVSDYDFVNERHWLPGEGKVNWQSLIDALNRINYKGAWLYEVGFVCPKTIIRDRLLTCEDFLRNYNELFKGKDLTVISRPVDNLGFSNV